MGKCCERVQSCSCKTNQCWGNTLNMAERQTHPSTGPGIHARRGERVVMGIGGLSPCRLGSAPRRAGRVSQSRACRDVTGSSSNASLHHQHGPCNGGGQQVHIPARHLGVVCYAGKLLPGCARLHQLSWRTETTKTSCLIPQVGASGGGSGRDSVPGRKGAPKLSACSGPLLGAC